MAFTMWSNLLTVKPILSFSNTHFELWYHCASAHIICFAWNSISPCFCPSKSLLILQELASILPPVWSLPGFTSPQKFPLPLITFSFIYNSISVYPGVMIHCVDLWDWDSLKIETRLYICTSVPSTCSSSQWTLIEFGWINYFHVSDRERGKN